ncbi:MAG: YceI family protein [Mizugakiibacter sp.]|uniref:YceI family protein n=1 Tax=Mizugakiibacter sp. TaxID=1972610 RepID=UPI0031BFA62D|nr:YceI family protein [Xanthomonadaceae bacterium]
MKRLVLALAALAFALPAAARDWNVDAARSSLGFVGTYQGEAFDGTFKRFTARIAYDPADLAHARFDVTVDLASAGTQNAERDQMLPGADFFDVAKFPAAHFVSSAFRRAADGGVLADGTLTLRGVSKPVTLTVKFAPAGGGATLDVATTLKRLDYGIGGGDWADTSVIADAVTVKSHLVLTPAGG